MLNQINLIINYVELSSLAKAVITFRIERTRKSIIYHVGYIYASFTTKLICLFLMCFQ